MAPFPPHKKLSFFSLFLLASFHHDDWNGYEAEMEEICTTICVLKYCLRIRAKSNQSSYMELDWRIGNF